MSAYFRPSFIGFIDIVYEIFIFFAVYLIIENCEA